MSQPNPAILSTAEPLPPVAPNIERGRYRAFAYLTQMARQSGIADASFCEEVFARFDHADGIRAALKRELKLQRLSEAQFYALVFLYSRDPVPVSPVDLAYYMERRSVRVILKQLASMDLVESAFTEGRRTRPFGLTDEGRHHTAFSIYRYLQAVTRLSAETGLKNG